MKILNIDDNDENRYLVETLLKKSGYEVVSAMNGAEGLDLLQSGGIDLIISDILMPVMDGFQLCRTIKADDRLKSIPFIIYTATYTGPQDEAFAMKIGADRFLQKPCEPELFLQGVQDVLTAAGKGNVASCTEPIPEEEALKLYSERLVRKLEDKMQQLENEVLARQQTEETLRRSEKKYKSLYNSIRDAILVVDMERSIIDCNQAFVDLFGYSQSEIIGKNASVVCENIKVFSTFLDSITEEIESINHPSAHFVKKNGTIFPGEINVFFLKDEDRGTAGFVGLIRDMTERVRAERTQKNLESQLYQAQKMESIARLAGGVAHDFNNMLSVIVGYTELTLKMINPTDKAYENLLEIQDAVVRSSNITRQLLAFARKQIIAPVPLDLNLAVEGTLKMLRRLIGEDIDLAWLPETNLWPVKMDPSQVDQILANLCVNARDAIDGVGRITIETDTAIFDAAYCADHPGFIPGDYVLLAVSDNGCGMDKETRDKIFEPFFTTKTIGKGTGLGLSTVYGIVKQNNGFINVYSEPGKGTTIKIFLSRHSEQPLEDTRKIPESIPSGHGETVLIVEDEPSILKLAERILKELGYSVLTAESPSQIKQLFAEAPIQIDLLFTDVVMPEMNGKDLSRQLQETCPDMKTLFMSGYTADGIAHHGILDEGVNFIAKPFSVSDLAKKVHEILSE